MEEYQIMTCINTNFGGRRPNTFEFYSDAVLVCTNIESHTGTDSAGATYTYYTADVEKISYATYNEIYHSANEERQLEQDEVSAEILEMLLATME